MAHQEPIRRRTGGGSAGSPSGPAPQIPDKLYFRIGEVAKLCAVPAYVLRFWESEFPQLKPNKGGTGQRLFRRRDVEMALRIKTLLYDEGFTIPGARAALKTELRAGKEPQPGVGGVPEAGVPTGVASKHLVALRRELKEIHALLSKPAASRSAVPIRRELRSGRTDRSAEPHPFPKPKLLPARPSGTLLEGLFDTLPTEDE